MRTGSCANAGASRGDGERSRREAFHAGWQFHGMSLLRRSDRRARTATPAPGATDCRPDGSRPGRWAQPRSVSRPCTPAPAGRRTNRPGGRRPPSSSRACSSGQSRASPRTACPDWAIGRKKLARSWNDAMPSYCPRMTIVGTSIFARSTSGRFADMSTKVPVGTEVSSASTASANASTTARSDVPGWSRVKMLCTNLRRSGAGSHPVLLEALLAVGEPGARREESAAFTHCGSPDRGFSHGFASRSNEEGSRGSGRRAYFFNLPVSRASAPDCGGNSSLLAASLRDRDQRHVVDQAVGQHEVAVAVTGVAHDVAAARDRPALEFLGLRIEAHDRVRRRSRTRCTR